MKSQYLMKSTKEISQDVAWEPFPIRNPVERSYPVKVVRH
jgi:hypothetical protein